MSDLTSILENIECMSKTYSNSTDLSKVDIGCIKEKLILFLNKIKSKRTNNKTEEYPASIPVSIPLQTTETTETIITMPSKNITFTNMERIFLKAWIKNNQTYTKRNDIIPQIILEKNQNGEICNVDQAIKIYKDTAESIRKKLNDLNLFFENKNKNANFYRIKKEYYKKLKQIYTTDLTV